jgi:late competence protein required for DNA uptake (superfamily II DNA/RNA helicase)
VKRTTHHIHRYEKVILGKNGYTVFKCNLPDCAHYVAAKLVNGKQSICNRCGNVMIMDARAMKLTKVHCVDCIEVRKKENHDAILDFLNSGS